MKTHLNTLEQTIDRRESIILALVDCVRQTVTGFGSLSFDARAPDYSLFDVPTFSVDVAQGRTKIATYKFNVLDDVHIEQAAPVCVFSPLVIQWADGGRHRKAGMDKQMIAHCLAVIKSFLQTNDFAYDKTLLTTAYLTKQRTGKQFFSGAGWDVIEFDKKDFDGNAPDLPAPYAGIAQRIEGLSAPHRTTPEEETHVCFAYIWLSRT